VKNVLIGVSHAPYPGAGPKRLVFFGPTTYIPSQNMLRQMMMAMLHSNGQLRTENDEERKRMSKTCSTAEYYSWRLTPIMA